jgi:hypothetical protein
MEDEKKLETLPVIDKLEFEDDEFVDEIGNKKTVAKIEKEGKDE